VTVHTFTELSVDESMTLLAQTAVGRLVYVADGEPGVMPVNYVFDSGTVVFRTAYGAVLDIISEGARVAFEVDDFDPATRTGWSVLVRGKAEEIWLAKDLAAAHKLELSSWAPGERTHFVRISPSTITGRRIQ
jgi:uncharacterized protein